ncbi:YqzL family protein [Cohnella kolymensis]|uniref:YqzL family protein n=1 Tax=Cohnella kolymensis TaxID=1590652 RepID=UPI0009E28721|nr:YqzL family protein [Cohnella kolymensis]
MRDFTWQVFTQTGDVEAYLLYKEVGQLDAASELGADGVTEEQDVNSGSEEG